MLNETKAVGLRCNRSDFYCRMIVQGRTDDQLSHLVDWFSRAFLPELWDVFIFNFNFNLFHFIIFDCILSLSISDMCSHLNLRVCVLHFIWFWFLPSHPYVSFLCFVSTACVLVRDKIEINAQKNVEKTI